MISPEEFQANLAKLRATFTPPAAPVTAQPPPQPVPLNPATSGLVSGPVEGGLDDGAKAELRRLPLLDVYRRWFAPEAERVGGGNEVNCSCFNTAWHRGGDQNPQFGINTAKNTYYCHACEVTGDIIDLAAVKYGLADGNNQCPDSAVHEAVRYAGEELLGMQFRLTPAGYQRIPMAQPLAVAQQFPPPAQNNPDPSGFMPSVGTIVPPNTPPAATLTAHVPMGVFAVPDAVAYTPDVTALAPPPYTGPRPGDPPALVVPVLPTAPVTDDRTPEEIAEDEEFERITAANFALDWRSFVPENTPLWNYMQTVCTDDNPEEFHFWNYIGLIGLTMGRKVFLPDTKVVYGNALMCLIGRTGQGKSRSESHINALYKAALPFNEADHLTSGVRIIKNPGSGESIAASFKHEVPDPTVGTVPKPRGVKPPVLVNPSVKAIIRWPEMSSMIAKSQNKGSVVQGTMIELYDAPDSIGGRSLTNGIYEAHNPFGTVVTTTQLRAIRKHVTADDAASGFLNRWWFIIGKSKEYQPFGAYIDIAPLKHDVEMLSKWVETKFRTTGGHHSIAPEAYDSAAEFLVTRARVLEDREHDEMLRRSTLTFKKLMLLMSANMMETEISTKAVEQAKIVFEYLVDCMSHIGVQIGQSDYEITMGHLTAAIVSRGDAGAMPRDIRRIMKRRTQLDSETVDKMLDAMQKSGRIELRVTPQPAGRVGRPTKRFFLCED